MDFELSKIESSNLLAQLVNQILISNPRTLDILLVTGDIISKSRIGIFVSLP
jgi:Ni,Fe-hydrogenase III small subunit